MIAAKDGSIYDRALVNPDRNNFGPRLGFAYTPMPKTVVRGGWGVSYVHVNRIGSANLLGDQRPAGHPRGGQPDRRPPPSFVPTEAGYPAGLTDPSKFNPLTALISYIPRDFHSSPVQSWHVSVQREFGPHMLVDVAYVGNKATDLLLVANYNQAAPNNAAGTIPLAARRPIPTWGDITYVFNGGKSRYDAFADEVRVAPGRRRQHPQLADAVEGEGQRRRVAREPERQLPGAAGHQQPRRRLRRVRLQPAVQQHHQLRVVAAVRQGQALGQRHVGGDGLLVGGWQLAGINTITPGEMVTLTYTPAAAFQVSGITNDFSGANNYRPNVTCDPYAARPQSITNWFNTACVVAADRSEPAVRQRAAQQRARTELLAVRSRGEQERRARRPAPSCSSGSRRSTCSTATTSWRPTATAAPRRSAPSPRPTMRGSCSWG